MLYHNIITVMMSVILLILKDDNTTDYYLCTFLLAGHISPIICIHVDIM